MNIFYDTLNVVIVYKAYEVDVPAGQYCRIFAQKRVKRGLKIGDSVIVNDGDITTNIGNIIKRKGSNLYIEPAEVSYKKKEHVLKIIGILKNNGFKLKADGYACLRLLVEQERKSGYG
jgi:uncharacterized Fe-S cluster-containing radical SAM superfamily protein